MASNSELIASLRDDILAMKKLAWGASIAVGSIASGPPPMPNMPVAEPYPANWEQDQSNKKITGVASAALCFFAEVQGHELRRQPAMAIDPGADFMRIEPHQAPSACPSRH
jgi:hypothetical protein